MERPQRTPVDRSHEGRRRRTQLAALRSSGFAAQKGRAGRKLTVCRRVAPLDALRIRRRMQSETRSPYPLRQRRGSHLPYVPEGGPVAQRRAALLPSWLRSPRAPLRAVVETDRNRCPRPARKRPHHRRCPARRDDPDRPLAPDPDVAVKPVTGHLRSSVVSAFDPLRTLTAHRMVRG